MFSSYYMPTRVISGVGCIAEYASVIKSLGEKAVIITGHSSSKKNGSLDDVIAALDANGQKYCLYDRVKSNPDIDSVYDGAAFTKENGADFVIAIGGGSPMDAAKAIAVLSCQDIAKDKLFAGLHSTDVMPTLFIPTTAGTGSEVTQYSILTNPSAQTKTTLAAPCMFPTVAMLDCRYSEKLPKVTTINTAIDALTHLIESYLSVKANTVTKAMSIKGIGMISQRFAKMAEGTLTQEDREALLEASMLGGIVIAQTGTTAVHAMGYSLTYFKDIDHGRANGLMIGEFLKYLKEYSPDGVAEIMTASGCGTVEEFCDKISALLGTPETITFQELSMFASIASKAKNIANCCAPPDEKKLLEMYSSVFLK